MGCVGTERRKVSALSSIQVFLNIVLDDAVEEKAGGEKVRIGMVVGQSSRQGKMFRAK